MQAWSKRLRKVST